tara:strand:- start:211 stop:1491 length:1281 start_codon:yes stop_codon:yes gene_type:complete
MTTTLTQVSNVFNLLCQLDSRLLNYHFGWQWDINKEIDNNFDPGNKTGRLFPAVQMDVPDYFQAIEEPNYDGTKEEIKVQLYFYDEQDYNNDSSAKTTNLIEQWTNLKTIAEDFVANYIEAIGPKKYNIGFITNPRYTQRSNLHNDRLILWEVEFILTHIAPCTIESSKINLGLLPQTIKQTDIEREVVSSIPEPPLLNMSLWLKGDAGINGGSASNGDPVSIWVDQSTKNYDFIQNNFVNQPTFLESGVNGQKGIVFTTPNLLANLGANFFIADEGLVFIVCKRTAPSLSGQFGRLMTLNANSYTTQNAKFMDFLATDAPSNLYNLNMAVNALDISFGALGTTAALLTTKKTSTSIESKRDGLLFSTKLGAQSLDNNTFHSIGSWSNAIYTLEGEIYEIIIYEQLISDSDILIVESYLKNKYAIT